MKILFVSNPPWCPTGYGVQSKLLIEYLHGQGHEIVFMANFGLLGGPLEKDGILYLPDDFGGWGNTSIRFNVQTHKPDVIISLADWFVFAHEEWRATGVPWFNWTPIDCNITYPERIKPFFENCFGIVPMSKFGAAELNKFGFPLEEIYHAVDPTIFKPIDKNSARNAMSFPNDKNNFIIGMNMANKDSVENRKAFEVQFKAIKKFINRHKELDVFVFLNSEATDRMGGINLVKLLSDNKLNLDKFLFTNPYKIYSAPYTPQEMALWYNSMDVVLNASSGEGFGIPIIEAQACGIPVVTHDATAMSELTFYGYAAKSNRNTKIELPSYGFRYLPSVPDVLNGLEHALNNRDPKKAEEVSQMVHDKFNITVIGTQWETALTNGRIKYGH